jgi:amidase
MTEIHFQSATSLARMIRQGTISARDLLEIYLARVDKYNPAINAIIIQDRDGARARADAADRARQQGANLGPLHGVPMTIKESYDLTGTPTTFGIGQLRDNIAQSDALAVERLTAAGANIFGKTNVPLRLADFQSYNEIYGVTNNPWDHTRTPGGSSGGSAAALASGMTALEIGSDIGGSIRNPAHYCGVFGHKPTWNLLSMRGHRLGDILTPTDISVIGPLARSAEDLELVLGLLSPPDEIEASGLMVDLEPLDEALSDLRIAVWSDQSICPVSNAVGTKIAGLSKALANAGATISDTARPDFSVEQSHEVFQALLSSAMSGRIPDAEFLELVTRAENLAADDQGPAAQQLRWQTMRAREWNILNEARTKIRWAWHRFFKDFDFVIAPIMPTTAFAHDHRNFGQRTIDIDGQTIAYFRQTFWAGLPGVAYLPATVIPTGASPDGLPIGIQIIGPAYSDLRTIQLARRLEAMGYGFSAPNLG